MVAILLHARSKYKIEFGVFLSALRKLRRDVLWNVSIAFNLLEENEEVLNLKAMSMNHNWKL